MKIKNFLKQFRMREIERNVHENNIVVYRRIEQRRANLGLDCSYIQHKIAVEDSVITNQNVEREKVLNLFKHLHGDEYEVMYAYYIACLPTWNSVSLALHWSERKIFYVRKRAFHILNNYEEEIS